MTVLDTTETDFCHEPLPQWITVSRAHITGQPIAECAECDFRSAYWECACDLVHDCKGQD